MTVGRRPRIDIERRREQTLAVTLQELSRNGLHGRSTAAIAMDAEVSRPHLIRVLSLRRSFIAAPRRASASAERESPSRSDRRRSAADDGDGSGVSMHEVRLVLLQG
ncbi:hypothetical protein UA75_11045 [Actinoalloteichus sp. GBA129-24]|nr:hypothetical protein UA75_11045 [Actinoalloteichus sp. GBA129-24]